MGDAINCREAEARLLDFLKRELTPELAAEVKAHIDHCGPCLTHARFEENFLLMLEAHARETCPGRLRERILAILRSQTGPG